MRSFAIAFVLFFMKSALKKRSACTWQCSIDYSNLRGENYANFVKKNINSINDACTIRYLFGAYALARHALNQIIYFIKGQLLCLVLAGKQP